MTELDDVLAHFTTPEFHRDPYPFLRELRERDPLHRTSKGFHLATRHADADLLLAAAGDAFRGPGVGPVKAAMPQVAEHPALWAIVTCMMAQNPPEHTRTRRQVGRYFTPRAVDELAGRVGKICDSLLDAVVEPLRDGLIVDLHHAVSEPLPLLVTSAMLGVPDADHGWLTGAVRDISHGLTAATLAGAGEELAHADAQTARMNAYFAHLAAERRITPGDDLISALVAGRDEDEPLTDDELVNLIWLLWLAGTDANAIAMDHCVWSMTSFPDQCGWLRGDHAGAVAFVDEVMRRTGPVLFSPLARPAVREIEVGGTRFAAGSDIRPVLLAANRDPAVFPDPDRFDPSRRNAASAALTFSAGIHRCLGVFLARTVLATASAGLHGRLPHLVAESEPRWGGVICDPATRGVPVSVGKR